MNEMKNVVPHFSLSSPRVAFFARGDFHARSRFARSTIPEGKRGLLAVYLGRDREKNRILTTGNNLHNLSTHVRQLT